MSSYQPSEFILGGDFLDDIGTTGDMRLPTPRNEVQAGPPPNRTVHHQPRGPRYDSYRAQNSFHHGGAQTRQPNPTMYFNNTTPRKNMQQQQQQQQVNNTMLNAMLNTSNASRGNYNWNNSNRGRNEHMAPQRMRHSQVENKVVMAQAQQPQFRFASAQQQQQQMATAKALSQQQQQILQQQQRIQQQQQIRQQQLVQQQQQTLHQIRASVPMVQQRAASPMFQQAQRQQHNFTTASPIMPPVIRPPTPVQVKRTPPPIPQPPSLSTSRSSSPEVEIINTINVPDKPPSRGNFILQPSPPPAQPTSRAQKSASSSSSNSDLEIVMTNIRPSNIIIKEKRTTPPLTAHLEKEAKQGAAAAAAPPSKDIVPKSVEPSPSPKQAPLLIVEDDLDLNTPRYECQLCSFFTSAIQQLDAHMYLTHQHKFKCKYCNIYLSTTHVGHLHWLMEHPQTAKQKPEIMPVSLKSGPHFRHSELFVCLTCYYIAPNRGKLEAHFLTIHPSSAHQVYLTYPLEDRTSFPKLLSNSTFNKENTYWPRYVFECDYCEGTHLSILLLRIHFMERHPDILPKFSTIPNSERLTIQAFNKKAIGSGQFSCSKCLVTEDTEENYTIHQYLCQKGHYKCGCCDFWATSEADIKKHHSKKHKELYFQVDVRRSLTRQVSLDTCSRYKCYYCTFFCFNSREMIYHCQKTHIPRKLPFRYYIFSSSKEEEPYLIEKSAFKCGHCDTFQPDLEETAKEHSLKSHGEEKVVEIQLQNEFTIRGLYSSPIWQVPYTCTFCKSKFQNLLSCYHHHFLWHPAKFFPFPLDSLIQKSTDGSAVASSSKRGRPKSKKKEDEMATENKREPSEAYTLQKYNINKDIRIVLDKLEFLPVHLSDDTECDSDTTVIQGEDSDNEVASIPPAKSPSPKIIPPVVEEKPSKTMKRKKSVTLAIAEESLNNIVGTVVAKESSADEQRQVPKTILKISKANLASPNPEWKVALTDDNAADPKKKDPSKKRKRGHSQDEDGNQAKVPKVVVLDTPPTVETTAPPKPAQPEKMPLRKLSEGLSKTLKRIKLKSLAPPFSTRLKMITASDLVRKYEKIREDAGHTSKRIGLTIAKRRAKLDAVQESLEAASLLEGSVKASPIKENLSQRPLQSKDDAPLPKMILNPIEGTPSATGLQLLPKGISIIPNNPSPLKDNAAPKVNPNPVEDVTSDAGLQLLPKGISLIPNNPSPSKINAASKVNPTIVEDASSDAGLQILPKGISLIPNNPSSSKINAAPKVNPTLMEDVPSDSGLQLLPKGISLIPIQTTSENDIQQFSSDESVAIKSSKPPQYGNLPKPESSSMEIDEHQAAPKEKETPNGSVAAALADEDSLLDDEMELGQTTDEEQQADVSAASLMSQLRGIQIIPINSTLPTLPASITLTPTKAEPPNNLKGVSIQIIPSEPCVERNKTAAVTEGSGPSTSPEEESMAVVNPAKEMALLSQLTDEEKLLSDSEIGSSEEDELLGKDIDKEIGEETKMEESLEETSPKKDSLLEQFPNLWNLQITRVDQASSALQEQPESKVVESTTLLPHLQITCMEDKNSKAVESTDDLSSINTFSDSSQDSLAQLSDVSQPGKKEPRKSAKLTPSEKAKKKLKILENLRCTKSLRSRSLDRAAKRVSIGPVKGLEGKRRRRNPTVKQSVKSSKNNVAALEKLSDNLSVTPTITFITKEISIAPNSSMRLEENMSSKKENAEKRGIEPPKVNNNLDTRGSFYPPIQISPMKGTYAQSPSKSLSSEHVSIETTCLYCSYKGNEKSLAQHLMRQHDYHFKCTTCGMHFEQPYLANHHHATERSPADPHHILPLDGASLGGIEDSSTDKCICEVCQAELDSYNQLRQHFKESHPGEPVMFIHIQNNGEFPSLLTEDLFTCNICSKFSGSYIEVVFHCHLTHKQREVLPTLHKAVGPFSRFYSCDYCDYTTGSMYLIDVHWDILHPDRTAKSYSVDTGMPECPSVANKNRKCKRCPFRALSADEVRAHYYLTHLGIFRCGSCTVWLRREEDVERHYAHCHPGEVVSLLVRNQFNITGCVPAILSDRLKCAYCIFFSFNEPEMKFHHTTLHAPRTLPMNYINFTAKGTCTVVKKDLYRCKDCADDSLLGFPEDFLAHTTTTSHQLEKITEDEEDILEEMSGGVLVKCKACDFKATSLPLMHHHHLCFHPRQPFDRQAYLQAFKKAG